MSDVGGVSGGQPQRELTPEEIARYRDDYNKGFKLFQEALMTTINPMWRFIKKLSFKML